VPHERAWLGERPDAVGSEFTAEARLADAAKWEPRVLRGHAVTIDADRAGNQLGGDVVG
jgi:hypothetical protein